MTRANRSIATVALAAVYALGISGPTASAAALDSLLASIAAAEAAPAERVRLFIKRGDAADIYYIDRIRPGRLHVIKNPRQNGLEMIIIDDKQWLRTSAGWQSGPAPSDALAKVAPSLTAIIRDEAKNAVEQDEADGTRAIEADMSWSAPALCAGRLRVVIGQSGRPSFLGFIGKCASKATVFHQAMSYADGFTIDPPQ